MHSVQGNGLGRQGERVGWGERFLRTPTYQAINQPPSNNLKHHLPTSKTQLYSYTSGMS